MPGIRNDCGGTDPSSSLGRNAVEKLLHDDREQSSSKSEDPWGSVDVLRIGSHFVQRSDGPRDQLQPRKTEYHADKQRHDRFQFGVSVRMFLISRTLPIPRSHDDCCIRHEIAQTVDCIRDQHGTGTPNACRKLQHNKRGITDRSQKRDPINRPSMFGECRF